MQLFRIFIVTTSIFSFSTYSVFASNNASTTVSVSGDIVTPLSIGVDANVRFGEVVVDSITAPSILITVTDQDTGTFNVSYTNNGSPDGSAGASGIGVIASTHNRVSIGPGKMTVTGEPNYHYVATRSNNGFAIMTPNAGPTMRIDTFSASRVLSATGSDSFYLGGVFTVPVGSGIGAYRGTVDITATYD